MMKQADIAPIGSTLLKIPPPFSSVGMTHPIFSQSPDLSDATDVLVDNANQIYNYISTYCNIYPQPWCGSEIGEFRKKLKEIK